MTIPEFTGLAGFGLATIVTLAAIKERRRREAVERRVRAADYNPILVKSLKIEGYAQPYRDVVTVTVANAHALALNVSAGIRRKGTEWESRTRLAVLKETDGRVEFPLPDMPVLSLIPGFDFTTWARYSNRLGEHWESSFGPDGPKLVRLDEESSSKLRSLGLRLRRRPTR